KRRLRRGELREVLRERPQTIGRDAPQKLERHVDVLRRRPRDVVDAATKLRIGRSPDGAIGSRSPRRDALTPWRLRRRRLAPADLEERQPEHVPPHPVEGDLRREELHPLAIPPELVPARDGAGRGREPEA